MLSPQEVYPLVLQWLHALDICPHPTGLSALAHLVVALLHGQSLRPSALMRALLSPTPTPVPARQRYKRVARALDRPWLTSAGLTPRLVRAVLALLPPEEGGGTVHIALDSMRGGRWEAFTLGVVWRGAYGHGRAALNATLVVGRGLLVLPAHQRTAGSLRHAPPRGLPRGGAWSTTATRPWRKPTRGWRYAPRTPPGKRRCAVTAHAGPPRGGAQLPHTLGHRRELPRRAGRLGRPARLGPGAGARRRARRGPGRAPAGVVGARRAGADVRGGRGAAWAGRGARRRRSGPPRGACACGRTVSALCPSPVAVCAPGWTRSCARGPPVSPPRPTPASPARPPPSLYKRRTPGGNAVPPEPTITPHCHILPTPMHIRRISPSPL